jgi:hypothetical protein
MKFKESESSMINHDLNYEVVGSCALQGTFWIFQLRHDEVGGNASVFSCYISNDDGPQVDR